MTPFLIAIDGESAAGKGTLARNLAEKLGFAYLDTGLLYRRTAQLLLAQGQDWAVADLAAQAAANVRLADLADPALRVDVIAQGASIVAAHPVVRQALLPIQRDFAQNPPGGAKGAVLDGRDIGTVICPDAQIKIYITANPAIRAERRQKELQNRGIAATTDAVLAEMQIRDRRDQSRATAPLIIAKDAWVLDTSNLSAAQALSQAWDYVQSRYHALAQK